MPAPDLAGARSAAVIRHDLPLKYAGKGGEAREDADLRPGSLRVSILEAEGLPARPDGTACRPHVVISVAELTRRRCRRTMSLSGPTPEWNESFDLDEVGGSGQVVVDLWDAVEGSGEPDLMGKAVVSLDECRPGVPHTFFKNMLVGKTAWSKCPLGGGSARLPAPPQCAPDSSGQLGTPRARPSHWPPRHSLGCSSELPPKSPILLPLAIQASWSSGCCSTTLTCLTPQRRRRRSSSLWPPRSHESTTTRHCGVCVSTCPF